MIMASDHGWRIGESFSFLFTFSFPLHLMCTYSTSAARLKGPGYKVTPLARSIFVGQKLGPHNLHCTYELLVIIPTPGGGCPLPTAYIVDRFHRKIHKPKYSSLTVTSQEATDFGATNQAQVMLLVIV